MVTKLVRLGCAFTPIPPAILVNNGDAPTDERLMAAFQRGLDEGAFRLLFERFVGPARAVAESMLGRAAAEDAVQEAFLRVVRSRESYNPSRPFAPWFYTILRNVCRDVLRDRGRGPDTVSGDAIRAVTADATPPDERLGMRELLEEISPGQRAVLELRLLHGLPFRRIAEALGISEEAAKKRAQRGLRDLRGLFFGGPDRSPAADDRSSVSARSRRFGD